MLFYCNRCRENLRELKKTDFSDFIFNSWSRNSLSFYTVYSYLMYNQAIDQNIFPKVLGTAQVFYCCHHSGFLLNDLVVLYIYCHRFHGS
jgi:hypothetical protein